MTGSKGQTEKNGEQPAGAWRLAAVDPPRRAFVFLNPLVVLLLYTLLALVVTHPLWLHSTNAVPGDIGDPLLNTWIIAWDAHATLTNPLQLFDANVFFPLPSTLAYSEHLFSTAALILPLGLASDQPVLGYNLSLLLSFPLAGLGMYLLALHWTHRHGAAFLAGLAYAFAPYRLAAIAHLQLLTIQWLPFSLLALDWMLKPQTPHPRSHGAKHWLLFVIFTTLQVLASWYLAVFTVLVLGLYTLGWWVAHLRRGDGWATLAALGRVAVAALVVAGLTLPFALPYLDVLPQLQAARPASLAGSLAAQPADFLAAPSYLRIAGPLTQSLAERPGFTEENALFLGIVALLLALVGLLFGRSRWRTVTLVAILAVSLALTFAGPYLVLTRLLPALTVVRVPPRWIIPATFAIAALAGYGAARLGESRNRGMGRWLAVVLVVGLLLVIESFAAPLPLAPVGNKDDFPSVYYALQREALREPGGWAVVEIPMHVAPAPEFPETKRMYPSTLGWWGLVNGYSGFTPARQMALSQALADFPGARAMKALRMLGSEGVRYLVVHPGEAPMDRAIWETTDRWRAERGTTLLPIGRFGPDDLYLINPYADELVTNPAAVTAPYFSAHTPTPVNVRFSSPTSGGEMQLLAYLYQPAEWQTEVLESLQLERSSDLPTEPTLTLYWQTTAPLDAEYTVFVHSLSVQGELIDQADGPPVANHYPTTAWRPGEIVQDSRLVPPGDHYLIGLYDPVTGERLPAFAADGTRLPDDAVVLASGPR
jgi:hypothetical protein